MKTVYWRTWALLVLGLTVLGGTPARATSVMALSLDELVGRSDLVVIGIPRGAQSRFRGAIIVTDVELQVEEVLKGDAMHGGSVVVTHPGGTVGDLALTVPGTAQLTRGRRVVAFLQKKRSGDAYAVVGMSQGALPVEGLGSQATVEPPATSAHLATPGPDGRLVEAPAAVARAMPLAELRAFVRGHRKP